MNVQKAGPLRKGPAFFCPSHDIGHIVFFVLSIIHQEHIVEEAQQHFIFTPVEAIDHSQHKSWLARAFGIANRTTGYLIQAEGGRRCYDRFIAFKKNDDSFDIFFKDEEFTADGIKLTISKLARRDGALITSENIDDCMKILGEDITRRQAQAHLNHRHGNF